MSIRSNRVISTTFPTHPQSPDVLYFLTLTQIDFRYDKSTAKETIRVDSIESSQINNIFMQIDFRYDQSTARATIRVDLIKSSLIANIFNAPCIAQMHYIFQVSCKSTFGMTTRQQGRQFMSTRSHRVESTTFSTYPA